MQPVPSYVNLLDEADIVSRCESVRALLLALIRLDHSSVPLSYLKALQRSIAAHYPTIPERVAFRRHVECMTAFTFPVALRDVELALNQQRRLDKAIKNNPHEVIGLLRRVVTTLSESR